MPTSLIATLGIAGWNHLDAIVLAAVATDAPLLLIGPHGSAKSLVLLRLAETLGLTHRHYNASLINLDDLVGFPVPQDGQLVYLRTPATVWDAEAVFVDEISRCRPELQNKLFPLIHERVVQGIHLEHLRHRWAAMNPPPRQDADDRDDGPTYAGAEALDIALADRFAFIVQVPGFDELSVDDQRRIVRGATTAGPDAGARWRDAIAETRQRIESRPPELDRTTQEYVPLVARALADAKHAISARRAAYIGRNIAAVTAALQTLGQNTLTEDSCYAALRSSLPDAAWGAPIPSATLLAAHRSAWAAARLDPNDERAAVLKERSPLRRIARALTSTLDATTVGQVVAENFSKLSKAERLTASVFLTPKLAARPDLPACAIEPVTDAYAQVAAPGEHQMQFRQTGQDWRRHLLCTTLPALDCRTFEGRTKKNVAIALLRGDEPFMPFELNDAWNLASEALGEADAESVRRIDIRSAAMKGLA